MSELQRLNQVHYEVMRLCLLGVGRNDIATAMGRSPEGIGLIINSPLFQDELAKRREKNIRVSEELGSRSDLKALDILRDAAADAARRHVDLLSNADPRVVQGSANAILDRVLAKNDTGGAVHLEESVVNLLQITINELKIVNLPSLAPVVERKDVEIPVQG